MSPFVPFCPYFVPVCPRLSLFVPVCPFVPLSLLLDHGLDPRRSSKHQPLLQRRDNTQRDDGVLSTRSTYCSKARGAQDPRFNNAEDPRFNTPRFNNNRSPFSPQQQNRLPPIQEPFTETFDAPVKQVPPSGQPRPTTPGTSPTEGEMMDRNPVPPASHVDQLVPPVIVLLRPHLKSHLRSHHEME